MKLISAVTLSFLVTSFVSAAENGKLEGLMQVLSKRTSSNNEATNEESVTPAVGQMVVDVPLEEVSATAGKAAQIFCQYSLYDVGDEPVTITWKVGDGPRYATEILKCSGYTHTNKRCRTMNTPDPAYAGRIRIAQETPSLEITRVVETDNRNYWCQVAREMSSDIELELDMKSAVLRVYGSANNPKLHTVTIDKDFTTSEGMNITIQCECDGRGSYCNDVVWYKGPNDPNFTYYDLVYTRRSGSRPTPTQYEAHNQWVDRAYLQGNSLVVTGVTTADAGRYWCEIRGAGFYGVGEIATDAKSMVLSVDDASFGATESFECFGKPDGLYADPEECDFYYECAFENSYHRPCPIGTVFNEGFEPPNQPCDFSYNVAPPCGTKTES